MPPGGLEEISLPLPIEDQAGPEVTYLDNKKELDAFWHEEYLLDKVPNYEDTLPYRLHSFYRIFKSYLLHEHGAAIHSTLGDIFSSMNGELSSLFPLPMSTIVLHSNYLGINHHTTDWRYSHGLFNPKVFPNIYEILQYEEKLLDYIQQSYISLGPVQARRKIQEKFHFNITEAQVLVLQAKNCITGEYDRDVDQSRTLMRARIDDFIVRSREALDIRAEAAGLRILTMVDGLTKTTPHNVNTEFREISKKIEKEEETNYISPPTETDSANSTPLPLEE